jgi:uncharacterized protein (UPF0335 family)
MGKLASSTGLRGLRRKHLDARRSNPSLRISFVASGSRRCGWRFACLRKQRSIEGKWWMMDDIAKTGVAAQELTQFVERVERLEEEKKAISDDIREVYAEMKGRGFDVRAVRQIVRIRKQDHSERKEMEAILELYMGALNMN